MLENKIENIQTKYKFIIIGGGISGLSCALTLSSGIKKLGMDPKENRILVIDNNRSDAKKARFFNATGVTFGISGDDLLIEMKSQINHYGFTDFLSNSANFITKINNHYYISTKENNNIVCDYLVIATGFKVFDLNFDNRLNIYIDKVRYTYSDKNRTMLKNINNKITDKMWVCGLLSGVYSQYTSTAASGTDTALKILQEIHGKFTTLHDNYEDEF